MKKPLLEKNRRVLVVDDNRSIHEDLRQCLGGASMVDSSKVDAAAAILFDKEPAASTPPRSFAIDSAYQGSEALAMVRKSLDRKRPYAMAFVDVRMPPGWNGVETIGRLWEIDPDIQIVLCTAYSDISAEEILRELGETDRLLMLKKPFDPIEARLLAIALTEKWAMTRQCRAEIEDLENWVVDAERVLQIVQESHNALESANSANQMRTAELAVEVQQRTVEAIATRDVAVLALAKLAESRDPETGEHLERMRAYTRILAEYLAKEGPYTDQIDDSYIDQIDRSAPLHDIGKVGVPDEILLKPGRLTPDEFEVMKKHTVVGYDALRHAAVNSEYGAFLEMAAVVARHHHERFDGTGYPDGLAGHAIPLPARIVTLADVFDALTSVRVYKEAMSPETARQLIEEQEGQQFDPAVVDAFRACYEQFLEVLEAMTVADPAVMSASASGL